MRPTLSFFIGVPVPIENRFDASQARGNLRVCQLERGFCLRRLSDLSTPTSPITFLLTERNFACWSPLTDRAKQPGWSPMAPRRSWLASACRLPNLESRPAGPFGHKDNRSIPTRPGCRWYRHTLCHWLLLGTSSSHSCPDFRSIAALEN